MESAINNTPPVDEPLMVNYNNCECVGYLDPQGNWHEWFSDKELKNVTSWVRPE